MATIKTKVDNTKWTLILSGVGIIQLEKLGHIHLHVGSTTPELGIESYHSIIFSNGIDFSYAGTENVYCMNGCVGSINLIHTLII